MDTSEIRNIQMVKRLATIYVVLNGLILLYDVPGAKYYGAEFEMSQLVDLIPYLWCSKQITVFTVTQTEEVFLSPLRGVVLRGAMAYAKLPTVRGQRPEDIFRADVNKTLLKTWRCTDYRDPQAMIDFNYITLEGDIKDTYKNVAENCETKVGPNEAASMLKALGNSFIHIKPIRSVHVSFYNDLQDAAIRVYSLTREDKIRAIQVVVHDYANKRIHIATEALGKLHDDIITEALQSCLYNKWQPQELLTGFQVRKIHPLDPSRHLSYPGVFDVLRITPEVTLF